MTNDKIKKLIAVAKQTREFAFVPESKHKVGAAVLTKTGAIFGGCNIDGVISGTGSCAERVAIDGAVAGGEREFEMLVVVDEDKSWPCGYCLQYLMQFADDCLIVTADLNGKWSKSSLKKLLPKGYKTKTV